MSSHAPNRLHSPDVSASYSGSGSAQETRQKPINSGASFPDSNMRGSSSKKDGRPSSVHSRFSAVKSIVQSYSNCNKIDANSIIEGEDFQIDDAQLEMIRLDMRESNSVSLSSSSDPDQQGSMDSKKFNSEHNSIQSRIIQRQSIESKSNLSQIVTKKKSLKYKFSHQALSGTYRLEDFDRVNQRQISKNEGAAIPAATLKKPEVIRTQKTKRSYSAMSLINIKNKLKLGLEKKAKPSPMAQFQQPNYDQGEPAVKLSIGSIGSISAYNADKHDTVYKQIGREDNRSLFWKKAEVIRKKLTISTSSLLYQVVKLIGIVLSFTTSFSYAYYAAFLDHIEEEEKQWFYQFDEVATIFFIADFIFLTIVDEHNEQKEGYWTLSKSLNKQIRQVRVICDIIAIIPFTSVANFFLSPRTFNLLYGLKAVRLYNGFSLLDYKTYKKQLILVQKMRVQKLVQNEQKRHSQTEDHTKMSQIVLISKILKISKLVIIMTCLSYFTGLIWFVLCSSWDGDYDSAFLDTYHFDKSYTTHYERISTLTYYAFTTLSTVGLGDFHPKNTGERVACSFIMLFGVMITSLLMDNFSSMIQELRHFNKNYEESDRFTLFLGTMKKLNGDTPLPKQLVEDMERFFQYKWIYDRNLAISTEEDYRLFEQLPGRVQTEIYVAFLFKHFTDTYKDLFDLHQNQHDLRRQLLLFKKLTRMNSVMQREAKIDNTKYYSKGLYDEFIVNLLRLLEPVKIQDGQIFQREGQENVQLHEIFFVMHGHLYVGYNHKKYVLELTSQDVEIPFEEEDPKFKDIKLNVMTNLIQSVQDCITPEQKFRFPIKFRPGQVVGFYEAMFRQPSQFHYRYREDPKMKHKEGRNACYFIRQRNWIKLQSQLEEEEENTRLINEFENNVLLNYCKRIYLPIMKCRRKWLESEVQLLSERFNPQKGKQSVIKALFGSQRVNNQGASDRLGLLRAKTQRTQRRGSFSSINSRPSNSRYGDRSRRHSRLSPQDTSVMNTSVQNSANELRDREQVVQLIATNELTTKPKVSKLLDRMVYKELKTDAVLQKKRNMEKFKRLSETQSKMITDLASDVEDMVEENFSLSNDVYLLKDQIHTSTIKFRREREKLWRSQKQLQEENDHLKQSLQQEQSKVNKLKIQNKLLKDLVNNFKGAIAANITFKEKKNTMRKISTKTIGGLEYPSELMLNPHQAQAAGRRHKSTRQIEIIEGPDTNEEAESMDRQSSPYFQKKGGFNTQDLFVFSRNLSESKSYDSIINTEEQASQGLQGVANTSNNSNPILNQRVNFPGRAKNRKKSSKKANPFYEMILNQVPEQQLEAYKQGFKPHLPQFYQDYYEPKGEDQPHNNKAFHVIEEEEDKEETTSNNITRGKGTSNFKQHPSQLNSRRESLLSENPMSELQQDPVGSFFEITHRPAAPYKNPVQSSESLSISAKDQHDSLSLKSQSVRSRKRKSSQSNKKSSLIDGESQVSNSLTHEQIEIMKKATIRRNSKRGNTPVIDSVTEIQSTSPFGSNKPSAVPRSGFFQNMNNQPDDESSKSSRDSDKHYMKGVNIYQMAIPLHSSKNSSGHKLAPDDYAEPQFKKKRPSMQETGRKQKEYLMRLLTNKQNTKSRSNTPSISVTSVDFTESERVSEAYLDTHGSHNNKVKNQETEKEKRMMDRYKPDRKVEEND